MVLRRPYSELSPSVDKAPESVKHLRLLMALTASVLYEVLVFAYALSLPEHDIYFFYACSIVASIYLDVQKLSIQLEV
jgi:hypothetical protein